MQIVETVMAGTTTAMRAARDGVRDADLVELRLDSLAPGPIDLAMLLADRTMPVVVTCRPTWEGGGFAGAEDERMRLLAEALAAGAEYVDVEWRADRSRLPEGAAARLVLSHHDFDGVPDDLASRVRAMRAVGAAVTKVAVMATRLGDVLTLREAMGTGAPHVAIAMGPSGVVTRVLPTRFGSCWTYAGSAAPGQIDAKTLRQSYRVDRVTPSTRVFALAGRPLGHSASPAIHNAAFAARRADAVYVPLESADADEFLRVADALAVEGASVTAPLKGDLARLSESDALSRTLAAVNTLKRGDDGRWAGANFDAQAFLDPLDARGVQLSGIRAVVLGAGGAARAVAWALNSRGARVVVAGRDHVRTRRMADDLGVAAVDWSQIAQWDLLVNATPVGTAPDCDASPVSRAALDGRVVYDLVYNPRETTLVRWARESGRLGIGGLEMLVSQAMRQFTWWTGLSVDRGVCETAAHDVLDRVWG